jgi:ABC-type Fe3+-siderophore transport system permease subunit
MIPSLTPTEYVPIPIAEASLQYFSPNRSVIVDMVMVQFISAIIVGLLILFFKGNELSTSESSLFIIGIFVSFMFLTAIYTRITR